MLKATISKLKVTSLSRLGNGSIPRRPFCDGIFDKVISREMPLNIVYEDEKIISVDHYHRYAPVHILMFPKVKNN